MQLGGFARREKPDQTRKHERAMNGPSTKNPTFRKQNFRFSFATKRRTRHLQLRTLKHSPKSRGKEEINSQNLGRVNQFAFSSETLLRQLGPPSPPLSSAHSGLKPQPPFVARWPWRRPRGTALCCAPPRKDAPGAKRQAPPRTRAPRCPKTPQNPPGFW